MVTFKQVEALYWVVKLGTFSAAAFKLHTTQSAITKRIQELEADFDLVLFDRSGQRAQLTSAGQEIYVIAEEMLAHRDRLLVRLRGQHTMTGTFRFGMTEITAMTWLPALIRLLRSHYPRISLEPHIDLASELRRRLHAGQLDMIFLHSDVTDARWRCVPLQQVELAWMGGVDVIDPLHVYTPAEIAAMPLLRQSRESGLNAVYDEWLHPHQATQNLFTINSLIAMAGLTAAGFGVSCLPRDYFLDMVNSRQLVVARTSVPPPLSTYSAIYRHEADAAFCESVAQLAKSCCSFAKPY